MEEASLSVTVFVTVLCEWVSGSRFLEIRVFEVKNNFFDRVLTLRYSGDGPKTFSRRFVIHVMWKKHNKSYILETYYTNDFIERIPYSNSILQHNCSLFPLVPVLNPRTDKRFKK